MLIKKAIKTDIISAYTTASPFSRNVCCILNGRQLYFITGILIRDVAVDSVLFQFLVIYISFATFESSALRMKGL